ncbi:MAG TPA: hypothetical protein ENH82_04180 [bacterium]|nr:hypothetical protein [bacterium]
MNMVDKLQIARASLNAQKDENEGLRKYIIKVKKERDSQEPVHPLVREIPAKLEIFRWLESQGYQTKEDETGEYTLYFEPDMPKILNDFVKWLKQESL